MNVGMQTRPGGLPAGTRLARSSKTPLLSGVSRMPVQALTLRGAASDPFGFLLPTGACNNAETPVAAHCHFSHFG